MNEPKPTPRIVKGPHEGVRRWRQGEEVRGRDNRPGHYSITGAFIVLPDSQTNSSSSGGQINSERPAR